MATRKAEVAVTCNINQPRQAQKILVTALESLQKKYDDLVRKGKQNEAETQKLKATMDGLASAVSTNEQNMNRVKTVMDNLSGSTLRQLNAALRDVKRHMNGLSSDSADLAQLRAKYNAITEQIKILKGETISVTKGIQSLSFQSDSWLTKAIAKQKELIAQTQRGTTAYGAQLDVLHKLTAEQQRRSLAAIQDRGNQAAALAANPANASASQLRAARQDLITFRDNIGANGIALGGDTERVTRIQQINTLLQAIDKQIDSISGKEQKVALNAQQIVNSVKQIDFSKATPTQLKAKLDEVNQALANMGKDDPMRSRLVASARQLQNALAQVNSETVNVQGVLDNLDKASPKKLKEALDQINRRLERMGANNKNRQQLEQDAERLRKALAATGKATVDIDKVLHNLKSTPLSELKKAAAQLEREIESIDRRTDRKAFNQKREQLRQLNQEVQRVNRSVSTQASAWKKTFAAISSYMGVTMIIGKVQQMITSVINLNLKFSDQLADIRKVSGLAMSDINQLADRLATIDTRTTIQELNSIAYAGAKLGIGKYGIEGLEGFTRAANQVNVALKEDLGQDALTALSKITEVMGLIPKMGVEKSMLATGSAMFQLSATSTATAGNIVEFSKRLTGLAKVTGITTDQLLGLASASDAMYLMPEVSATAFNKLFTSIQTKHNLIEKELNIDPGTIKTLFAAGRAMDAIVLIFERMKQKGNMNALQGVFKDLGSDGARLVNVMVTMSQNVDMLRDHLEIAKDSFSEATAVTNEYNIQQQTANALMERASNLWQKAFTNPEGVDAVRSLAQWWYDVSKLLTETNAFMAPLRLGLDLVIAAVKTLIFLLPTLLMFMAFKGVYATMMGLVSAYNALTGAQIALNNAMKANVWLGIASAIMAAVTAIYGAVTATDKASASVRSLNSYLAEAESQCQRDTAKLRSYVDALDNANTSTTERERLLRQLNKEYRPYINSLGIEIQSVQDLKDNYAALNDEIRKKMYYQMRERALSEILDSESEDGSPSLSQNVTSARLAYRDFISDPNNVWASAFDAKWLDQQVSKGLSAEDIAKSILHNYKGIAWRDSGNKNLDHQLLEVEHNETGNRYMIDLVEFKRKIQGVINANQAYNTEFDRIVQSFPDLGGYSPDDTTGSGTLDNDAPDKDAIKAARQEAQRQRRAYKEEIKDLQNQVTGIIDNLKNFYTRQAAIVTEFANEAGWDPALLDNTLDIIEHQRDFALAEARKAIAGVPNQWNQVLANLETQMAEMDKVIGTDANGREWAYNASRELIGRLRNADPEAIRNRLGFLDRELGASDGTSLAEVWNKASENEKHRATAQQRRQREYQQYLLENNYTRKVDSDYTESMTRLGYFDFIDLAQNDSLLRGSAANASPEEKAAADQLIKDRMTSISIVLGEAVDKYVDLIAIGDVSTPQGRNDFLSLIFGEDYDESAIVLRGIVESDGSELQVFYDQLLKYVDDYTEATKKAEDRTRKLADFQWSHSPEKQSLDSAQTNNDLYGRGILQHRKPDEYSSQPDFGVYGNTSFVSDFGVDPEIEAYRLKIEAAKAYYDFLKAHGMEEEQLHEQQMAVAEAQAAYVEKLTSRIKKQMDEALGMHEPIETFGTKAGEAFALMTEDAEAGRKALKAAVGDMINDFMKQTVEMTKEYIKRRLMQKIHDRLTSVEASAHEAELTEIQTAGDATRLTLHETIQTGLTTIDQTQAAVRETTNVEEHATELGVDAAAGTAEVAVGTASGAAKTIGSLGWWGIPLVAVISALLGALLSFAMSKVSKFFGGGTAATDTGPQTKLVSGMLTYDSGNVQAFRGVEDGKTYPVVGSDGKVYAAKDGGELSTGLVEDPITTLVNGQPALVAERGPEMVIGRETTAAMMMARPDILAEIVKFDRQRSGRTYRAYDSGNIDSLQFSVPDGSAAGSEDMAQLRETINALTLVLSALQRDGIPAHINKYGRGGVTESARSGGKFMQRNSGDPLWRS